MNSESKERIIIKEGGQQQQRGQRTPIVQYTFFPVWEENVNNGEQVPEKSVANEKGTGY